MVRKPLVYVLSDSVGETAELVIKAGLSQFNNGEYKIHRIPYVDDKKIIDETLELAKDTSGIIGFTLVDPILQNYLNEQADTMGIEAIDITGPTMKSMERVCDRAPRLAPGRAHTWDEEYMK